MSASLSSPDAVSPGGAALTTAAAAAALLRRDIVAGILPPSHKLKMRELEQRYGLGATPLREALVHLAARGLVVAEGQKGFRVPGVDREDLLDVTQSRQIVEPEALRLAMLKGGTAWEDEIIASFHLLRWELERQDPTSEPWLDLYEERHHRFHRALIAACPLAALRGFCDELYVRKTRYRRVLRHFGRGGSASIRAHDLLRKLVLARDEQNATAALHAHIEATADAVLKMLPR
jgi:DNA-binding GntR family transcriptional regulator